MTDKNKPHYHGHRQRLRDRFLKTGGAGLEDYEMLELILFRSNPRTDVKPLAKDLLARFGSFGEVISAAPERLREVKGIGESAIAEFKIVQAAAIRLTQAQALGRPALSSWSKIIDYCRASMAFAKKEQFRILFLDNRNVLIADEVQQEGTVNHTPVYPREVTKRALELDASAIILVHNHPSGDPTPSRADIDMTRQIVDALKTVSILVHDHLIIGREQEASFKQLQIL